jgi:SAM-dependent methyltransferase
MHLLCPCCNNDLTSLISTDELSECLRCGHICRNSAYSATYSCYRHKFGRNDMPPDGLERKFQDRLSSLVPLVKPSSRVVEIGCAEGELCSLLKSYERTLEYWGVEPSQDSAVAEKRLDGVVSSTQDLLSIFGTCSFDEIYAFHVLEHISDVNQELTAWRNLLKKNGTVWIEVPNKSGNRLISVDRNPEHLHSFSVSSINQLLHRNGFDVASLTTGHYESAAYNDSIRLRAVPSISSADKEQFFLAKLSQYIETSFSVWGIGGDFRSYLEPYLDHLPILSLIDNDTERHGSNVCGRQVEAYDLRIHQAQNILISSIKYETQIANSLRSKGHPPSQIFSLSFLLNL